MANEKILVVDDDKNICELLRLYLVKEGYSVTMAHDGEAALTDFDKLHPDLVLLDVMMPVMDGWEVCRKIRAKDNTPIIMLTAKGETYDKVLGLELGADDYIVKPFDAKEVTARIKAVLRRTHEPSPGQQVLAFKSLQLNLDKKTVSIDDEEIPFSKTEFEILALLLREKGRVFSRQELINRIWPRDVMVLDRTVDVNITRVRKKIKDYARHIVTRLGYGYFFEE